MKSATNHRDMLIRCGSMSKDTEQLGIIFEMITEVLELHRVIADRDHTISSLNAQLQTIIADRDRLESEIGDLHNEYLDLTVQQRMLVNLEGSIDSMQFSMGSIRDAIARLGVLVDEQVTP